MMTDDEIEALAKKHIAPHADRLANIRKDWPPYRQTEQFRRVKAFVRDVEAKLRAPVAGEVTDDDIWRIAQMSECHHGGDFAHSVDPIPFARALLAVYAAPQASEEGK